MHSVSRAILPLASGAICFFLGLWTGGRWSDAPTAPSAGSTEERSGNAATGLPGFGGAAHGENAGGGSPFGGPGEKGAAAGLVAILENPDRRLRERELEALGARDFAEGVDWRAAADAIGDRVDRSVYLKGVVAAWATENPREAVAYLSVLGLSDRANLVPHAVSVWAGSDPTAAESWVLGLAKGEVRDLAIESLYRSWAVGNPPVAAASAQSLEDESARLRALVAVVREWSANDLGAVGKWAAGLADPNAKDVAVMAVADEMSARAPIEAMRWASAHLAADPLANPEIVQLVASKAGFEAPRETFAWLTTVPPSAEAAASLAGVASYLVEEDPGFAWDGFAKLPEELKQVTADSVASTLGTKDPETGKRWLGELEDGETKRWATSAFVSGWAERDPGSAEAWVESLPPGPERDAAKEGLSSAETGSGAGGRAP